MTCTLNLMALQSQVSFSMSSLGSSLTEQNVPARGNYFENNTRYDSCLWWNSSPVACDVMPSLILQYKAGKYHRVSTTKGHAQRVNLTQAGFVHTHSSDDVFNWQDVSNPSHSGLLKFPVWGHEMNVGMCKLCRYTGVAHKCLKTGGTLESIRALTSYEIDSYEFRFLCTHAITGA